jgi:hypothetical protein
MYAGFSSVKVFSICNGEMASWSSAYDRGLVGAVRRVILFLGLIVSLQSPPQGVLLFVLHAHPQLL